MRRRHPGWGDGGGGMPGHRCDRSHLGKPRVPAARRVPHPPGPGAGDVEANGGVLGQGGARGRHRPLPRAFAGTEWLRGAGGRRGTPDRVPVGSVPTGSRSPGAKAGGISRCPDVPAAVVLAPARRAAGCWPGRSPFAGCRGIRWVVPGWREVVDRSVGIGGRNVPACVEIVHGYRCGRAAAPLDVSSRWVNVLTPAPTEHGAAVAGLAGARIGPRGTRDHRARPGSRVGLAVGKRRTGEDATRHVEARWPATLVSEAAVR